MSLDDSVLRPERTHFGHLAPVASSLGSRLDILRVLFPLLKQQIVDGACVMPHRDALIDAIEKQLWPDTDEIPGPTYR